MEQFKQFCITCQIYNCRRHKIRKSNTTGNLKALLGHFQPPDDEMRTYTDPDKSIKSIITKDSDKLRIVDVTDTFSGMTEMGTILKPIPMPKNETVTPTSIVIVDNKTNSLSSSSSSSPIPLPSAQTSKKSSNTIKCVGSGYRAHEKYHFVKIKHTSFVSCSSPTGLYSEIALVLWIDGKQFVKHASSMDRYRVVINMMYDMEADLWCVSAKLLKRSYYQTKDDEENSIPNRLCSVSELRAEVKQMLLFFGISPREAYRMFRHNLSEDIVTVDSGAGFMTTQTKRHEQYVKDLEKPPTTTYYDTWGEHGYKNNMQPNRHHRSGFSKEKDKEEIDYSDVMGMFSGE